MDNDIIALGMSHAYIAAKKSICSLKKVGTSIYTGRNNWFSGYNQNVSIPNNEQHATSDSDGETLEDVIHAEMDCIFNFLTKREITPLQPNFTKFTWEKVNSIFTTHQPCMNCAKHIVRMSKSFENAYTIDGKLSLTLYFDNFHNDLKSIVYMIAHGIDVVKVSLNPETNCFEVVEEMNKNLKVLQLLSRINTVPELFLSKSNIV